MRAKWSDGYTAELPYLPTYLSAQAPPEMAVVCALAGVHCGLAQEGLAFLDLGCGRGMSVLAMAAANPSWTAIGLDYMPAHVSEAREIAAAAGLDNAQFHEADIAALDEAQAARLLPELDVVTIHGLWTWVSGRVREGILRLLRSRLKPGGLVLVTYNALPGWADDLALRRLLSEVSARMSGPADRRMAEALEVAHRLHAAGMPSLERSHFMRWYDAAPAPTRASFARYAVHEFLSEHWEPAWPEDVAAAFAEAKLDLVGPAALAHHFPDLTMPPALREALGEMLPGLGHAFLRDTLLRVTLRQDLFVRGRRPADAEGQVRALTIALRQLPADGRVRLDAPGGEAELPPPVIGAALAALAEAPRSIGELLALPEMARTTAGELLAVLVGSRIAAPVWRAAPTPEMQARAARFNRVLLQAIGNDVLASGGDIALAAPMLGAGMPVKPVAAATMLALLDAAAAGQPTPDAHTIACGMLAGPSEVEIDITERAVVAALAEGVPAWRSLGLL